MDVSVIIAFASLAFAIVVQIAVTAFLLGGLFNRVRQLESQDAKRVDLKPELMALAATVSGLSDRMSELKKDSHDQFAELGHILRNRLMVPTAPGSR